MSRRFGVEIEHKQPKFTCGPGCSLKSALHLYCQSGALKRALEKSHPTWSSVAADGSGCEVQSPILCGEEGLKELEAIMSALRDMGGKVYQADGLHVHHDAPEYLVQDDDLSRKRIITLAQSWCNNQAVINELVMDHRRSDWFKCEMSGYAPTSCYRQVTSKVVEQIKEYTKGTDYNSWNGVTYKTKPKDGVGRLDRMYALNVSALHNTGTIEIRQYQGTLDFDRARAWIRFGQQFIETCLQDDDTPIAPYPDIDRLMVDIGLDSAERAILREVGT